MNTTEHGNQTYLRDAVGGLVDLPVRQLSIASEVSTVIASLPGAHGFRVPTINADPAAEWVAEGAEIPASNAALGEAYTPFFKIAGTTTITREMASDSNPGVMELVGRGLASDLGRKLDSAFFTSNIVTPGTPPVRNVNRPQGLEDLGGVNEIEAGAAWTDADVFAEAVFAAESVGATIKAWVANPADALALAKVKRGTGSNEALLATDATQVARRVLAGVPLLVSPYVVEGHVWGIPKDRVIVAKRQDTEITYSEEAAFTTDSHVVRAVMRVGFLFTHPQSVQKIVLTD